MKKSELKQIIQEEVSKVLNETRYSDTISKAIKDKAKGKSQDEIIGMIFNYLKNDKMPTGENPRWTRNEIMSLMNDDDFLSDIISDIQSKELNEISPELFKRATNISRSRNQDQRTVSMGRAFFSKFIGKPLLGGTITDIVYHKYHSSPSKEGEVSLTVTIPGENDKYIYYDVQDDDWGIGIEITRADARILSLIAKQINPETKYGAGGQGFRIKGYGMTEKLNENSEKYMFFQNLETIKKEVEEMLSLDPQMVDAILANGHDWAADHIATSKDDIEEVHNFLMSNKAPMDELTKKQMKIAKAAPPEDKITGADFAALRKGK
jgi:hypothetical protein